MCQLTFVRAIYQSFYSRELYREVNQKWDAGVFGYLFLVLSISWACMMVNIHGVLQRGYDSFGKHFVHQIPDISIKNGTALTKENRPYFIKDPDNNEIFAIIDTSGQYKNLDNNSAEILITKNAFIYREHPNVVKVRNFSKDFALEITPEKVHEKVGYAVRWLWVILFPVFLILSFLYRIVQAFLYAILGKFFAWLSDVHLNYFNILKLSMVAITPVIVFETIFDCLNFHFHLQWLLYFILAMGYLIFAIRATKN
jgi:hypothetical protein